MATVGSMIVNVLANTSSFAAGMNAVRGQLRTVKSEAAITQTALAGLGSVKKVMAGLGVGISAGAVIAELGRTADEIDNLVKVSDRLGITTENLRGLQFGAELAGVSAEDMNSALGFMSKQLAEAAHNGGKAKGVIKELGLDAQRLAKQTPDEALLSFARALSGVRDNSEKVRIAMRVFGNAGQPLLTLLNEGEDAIRGYMSEADRLGLTYSKAEADKVVQFNDAWEKLQTTLGGFSKDIVIDVAPAAIGIVNDLQDLLEATKGKTGEAGYTGDVRTGEGKPAKLWAFGDIFGHEDMWARYALGANKIDQFFGDPIGTRPSVEAPAFTRNEIIWKQNQLDPRFRPGGAGEAAAGMPTVPKRLSQEQLSKIVGVGLRGARSGLAQLTGYLQDGANKLKQLDTAGATLGKQMLNKDLLWRLQGKPGPFTDYLRAKEAEQKKQAASALEEAKKREAEKAKAAAEAAAETRFKMLQPAPTAQAGTEAAAAMVSQARAAQQQAKLAQEANKQLKRIGDALAAPQQSGL